MRTPVKTKAIEVVVQHDVVNEQVIIAAAMADSAIAKRLIRIQSDYFQTAIHQQFWNVLQEMYRRGLDFDFATIQTLDKTIDIQYFIQLSEARPDIPPNIDHHVKTLQWDKVRARTVNGPVAAFLNAIVDPRSEPERIRSLAKGISGAFDNYEERAYLRDSEALVREQIADLKNRRDGFSTYTYGIESLDKYEDGTNRMIPGAKPGEITIITGLSGSGKTTLLAQMILGIARDFHNQYLNTKIRKKILFGAWETQPGPMLELMACMSLNMSRSDVILGNVTDEQIEVLQHKQMAISEYVKFMDNPFQRRRGERRVTNDDNLDLIHNYIEDCGADIFVADLLQRAFIQKDPEQEESALFRFQAIMQQTHCHGIVCHQIRLKDIENRTDKRPTREGMKGSGAWTEISDTILGVHRPALWSNVPDKFLQIMVLKQRWGKWPLAIEFETDPSIGLIYNGRSIEYNRGNVEASENISTVEDFISKKSPGDKAMSQRNPERRNRR